MFFPSTIQKFCISPAGDDRNILKVYVAGRLRSSRDGLSSGMKPGRVPWSQYFHCRQFQITQLCEIFTCL